MKEILLLVDEVHQRNHYFGTTLNADSEDAWKSIANKIIASFILVVCTPSRCKKKKRKRKSGVTSYQMFKSNANTLF